MRAIWPLELLALVYSNSGSAQVVLAVQPTSFGGCVCVCVCGKHHTSETSAAKMTLNQIGATASTEMWPLDLFDGWFARPFESSALIGFWKTKKWIYNNNVDVKILFVIQFVRRASDKFFSVWFVFFYGEKQILLFEYIYVHENIDSNRFPGLPWR